MAFKFIGFFLTDGEDMERSEPR